MSRVAFKGAVVDFLGQRHGAFDDRIAGSQHPGKTHGTLGYGDGIADGHAHGAAADQLGNGNQDRNPFPRGRAQHGMLVAAPAGYRLERQAVHSRHAQDFVGDFLRSGTHGVGHVPGRFDDFVLFGQFLSAF